MTNKLELENIEKRLNLLKLIRDKFIKYMNYFFENRLADIKYVFSWQRLELHNNLNKDTSKKISNLNNLNENFINHKILELNENYFIPTKESIEFLKSNTDIIKNIFKKKLVFYFKKDLTNKTTATGPHRDDINIYIDNCDIKNFGSQGQQRIAAVCLKLAELDILSENFHEKPILLLDDVLSELDFKRKHLLLKLISNNFQTFITAANFDYLKDLDLKYCDKFLVKDNKITKYCD
jgi:DNA replication and repair protein RecF